MSYIERHSHLALNVRDLDRSAKFYTEVVGLTVKAYSGPGEPPMVILNEGIGLKAAPGLPEAQAIPVVDHIAFKVPGLAPVIERLKAAGAAIVDGPRPSPYGNSVYFLDPDGNRLECHDGERA